MTILLHYYRYVSYNLNCGSLVLYALLLYSDNELFEDIHKVPKIINCIKNNTALVSLLHFNKLKDCR